MGENIVAELAIEPIVAFANKQELQDYTLADSLRNVALSATAGTGIQLGIGKFARFLKQQSVKYRETLVNSAVAQLQQGKRPDLEPLIRDRAMEFSGQVRSSGKGGAPSRGSRLEYDYQPLNTKVSAKGKIFFHGSTSRADTIADVDVINSQKYDDDFGFGLYLTDDINTANGAAASKYTETNGRIHQVELQDVKLLDLEQRLPDNLENDISLLLGGKINKKVLQEAFETNGRAVYDLVRDGIADGRFKNEAIIDEVNAIARGAGFDGIRYEGRKTLDVDTNKHNAMVLFDRTKLREDVQFEPDRNFLQSMTREESQNLAQSRLDRKNDLIFHQKSEDEFDRLATGDDTKFDAQAAKENIDDLDFEIKTLKDQGLLDAESLTELQELKKLETDGRKAEQIINNAKFCLKRNR